MMDRRDDTAIPWAFFLEREELDARAEWMRDCEICGRRALATGTEPRCADCASDYDAGASEEQER